MKLLTSSPYSSSSSPSSTLSFDPTLCSSKTVSAGCLTNIFHRILCSGGALPTHPLDQIRELCTSKSNSSCKVQQFKGKHKIEASNSTTSGASSPGIVARLMGLDSMGERDTPSEEVTPSSLLSRSRSLNSADYLGQYCKQMEGTQYRRVKSSTSFREVPSFQLLENEDFFEFSFESCRESREFKSRGRRKEKGSSPKRGELKKNKKEKVHHEKGSFVNVGNGGGKFQFANNALFKVFCEKEYSGGSEAARLFSQSMKRKEVNNGEKVKRRKKGKTCCREKKVESECSSEDSSPVSVFDFEREAPGTEVDYFGIGMSWRRKLSPELENNDQIFILRSDCNLMNEERKVKAIENNMHAGSKKKEKERQECVDIWGEICRLVEDELVGSNQLQELKRKQGDFESISADFESEIFDYLLDEFIDQLVCNPLKALQI